MKDDRFTELAPDYALGLLEGEALEEFERHLAAGCAACESELASMDSVGDALAYSTRVTPVPPGLRDRVLGAIDSDHREELSRAEQSALDKAITGTAADRRLKPRGGEADLAAPPFVPPAAAPVTAVTAPALRPTPPPAPPAAPSPYAPTRPAWPEVPSTPPPVPMPARPGFLQRIAPPLALAAMLAAGLSLGYAVRLQKRLDLVRADLERVTLENQALARIMDVVNSPKLRVVALGGMARAPGSEARVLWSPTDRKAILIANGLPTPPAGMDYQLWVIEGKTPRSEGVFPVDEQGRATHVLPSMPESTGVGAFAVTLEPAGGMPQPTGEMYLLGPVTKVN